MYIESFFSSNNRVLIEKRKTLSNRLVPKMQDKNIKFSGRAGSLQETRFLMQINDLPCAYCARPMLRANERNKIVDSIVNAKNPTNLRNKMNNSRRWVTPEYRGLFDLIVKLSQIYPNKNFVQILRALSSASETVDLTHSYVQTAQSIDSSLAKLKAIVAASSKDTSVKKNGVDEEKDELKVILKKSKLDRRAGCLLRPSSLKGKTDSEIVGFFFKPRSATREHIIPYKITKNWIPENILIVHDDCNRQREKQPFYRFLSDDVRKSLDTYFRILKSKLSERKFRGVDYFIARQKVCIKLEENRSRILDKSSVVESSKQ